MSKYELYSYFSKDGCSFSATMNPGTPRPLPSVMAYLSCTVFLSTIDMTSRFDNNRKRKISD